MTLNEVIDLINAAAPGKLSASYGADNNLVLTDATVGANTFTVEQLNASHAAADLGLDVTAAGGTITGRRLLAGLKTTLVDSFNGGAGFNLGLIQLTDRSGATASVDLSAAATLDDMIAAINSAGVGIQARVNDARNGILALRHNWRFDEQSDRRQRRRNQLGRSARHRDRCRSGDEEQRQPPSAGAE